MSRSIPIKCALISVYEKSGLTELAAFLLEENIHIISTGGTAKYLRELGVAVSEVSSIGDFPEILDGRVKTLNPRIHAGILYQREKPEHEKTVYELAIPPIDLVVANLYPFAAKAEDDTASIEDLVENIDIGGPAMLRAAAKNYRHVAVLHAASKYNEFIAHYRANRGTTLEFRQQCSLETFSNTAAYDQVVASVLSRRFSSANPNKNLLLALTHHEDLRYGENPHQAAASFTSANGGQISLSNLVPISGKQLSYNNLLDTHAAVWALRCLSDHQVLGKHGAIVVKHGVPCGAARAQTSSEAVSNAIASDEKSAFGGIIATSSMFDVGDVRALKDVFFEIIIAPSFSEDALHILSKRKNLRLIAIANLMSGLLDRRSYRSIFGGILAQDHDTTEMTSADWTTVTKIKPNADELVAMDFAFRVAKATPSNAIAIATGEQLLGLGAGQPNRIQSVELAISGALERGFDIKHAALASDAFFPFDDGLKYAHDHGIRLVIQPGGSVRDHEIIACADNLGLSMVFTHRRHFRH